MTISQLVEYINLEKNLRGLCVVDDPREVPINKLYYLSEKYINKPLWCISADTMQVFGVIMIESCRQEFDEIGAISHYTWKVKEFHPVNQFMSPLKQTYKAPTHSFGYKQPITEEFFQKIPTFKSFLN